VENHFKPIADRRVYLDEARRLQNQLMGIDGVTVLDSQSTFMLCRLENGEAAVLKKWLMDNYGILIRDASNFRGLDRRFFRVAAQSEAEDDVLVSAVKEFLSGTSRHFKRYW
jgi:threonine-phosphate decarboxylase